MRTELDRTAVDFTDARRSRESALHEIEDLRAQLETAHRCATALQYYCT